uniref:Uncharacterized protein n=1 Tax=Eucampia antarctica TaxID=49252 RepID=A0A7S2WBQ8_9STRA
MISTSFCIDTSLSLYKGVDLNYQTCLLSTLFIALILVIAKYIVFYNKNSRPLKGVPLAPNSHWFLGRTKLFLCPDFEKSWRTLAYDNANDDGVCSFWVRRKPTVTVTKVEHARAICIARSYRKATPVLTKHIRVLGGSIGLWF